MKRNRTKAAVAAIIFAAALLLTIAVPVSAAEDTSVYVTIANGELVLAYEEVELTDADGDNKLTVNDALISAHDKKYDGGAEAGYGSAETDYGLSLTKLWGVENGSGYGYCVNNASAMSLADEVKAGDHIYAYVYTDTKDFSDTYSYFDATTSDKSEVTLTLMASGYDENWAPVSSPVEGAVITVDGIKTDVKTDADGKATVKMTGEGRHVVSAVSDSVTLVPPVCIVNIAASTVTPPENAPATGSGVFALAITAVISLAVGVTVSRRRG